MLLTAVAVVLMFLVHAGPVYDLALRHRFAHDAQHVLFVLAGALCWGGALGARARQGPSRLIAALTAATGLTLLVVPTLYDSVEAGKERIASWLSRKQEAPRVQPSSGEPERLKVPA